MTESIICSWDFAETSRKQKQFLTQFLGGPNLYTEEHGHPMLKRDIWNLKLQLMKEMHG